MTPLTFVRLYDSIALDVAECKTWKLDNTTTFAASETCELSRDGLGWVRIRVGRKESVTTTVADEPPFRVIWRERAFLMPPHAVKWAECEPAVFADFSVPPAQQATGTDPTFLHPKAKRR